MNIVTRYAVVMCTLIVVIFTLYPISASAKAQNEPLPLSELRAFTEAYYQIKSNYIKPVDDATLIREDIKGMVAGLDRHSRYLPPGEFERFNADNEGEYAGIGLSFNEHKFGIEVSNVVRNSPADRAGITPGMLVTHVNQHEIKFMTAEKAYKMLLGEVGTSVELTVASAGFPKPKSIQLRREFILVESVTSELLPNDTGYVAISQFTLKSVEEFDYAINKMSNAQQLQNLIIDLRNNPGGVMEVAVQLSDLFIKEGKLLISTGRTDESNQVYYATESAPLSGLNVIVVINSGSASASEILAAALHDHQKALILGEKSYGKGSIQSIIPLNDDSGIKLTSAEYFSPKGNRIQDIGIQPDVAFNPDLKKNPYNVSLLDDPQLLQAYNLLPKNNVH